MTRRLLALVAGRDDPSTRFRVDAYADAFAARGVAVDVVEIPARGAARRDVFARAADADATVWLRRLLVPRDVARLRAHARRLVYEFDDAMAFRDSARGATTNRVRLRKFAAAVRAADCVVAGNRVLAALAGDHGADAVVVPTVVEPSRYASAEARPTGDEPVVGWIGTAANYPYLAAVVPALERLRRARPFALAVMAESPPPFDGATFTPWSVDGEVAFLRRLDVGLMPLVDDAWCRGKCGAKALQYLAAGVPVVASAVGDTARIVGPGGYATGTVDGFCEALDGLLADAALRTHVGAAGRQHVAAHFAPDRWADRLLGAYFGEEAET